MLNSDHPRILLCRLSALGDCVHTMPLASALRRHVPGAHITWLTQRSSLPLIQGHPGVDEFLTVEKGFMRSPRQVHQLRRAIRLRGFDVTIDPQSLSKSATPAWFSSARMRIGFAAPDGREVAPWLNNVLVRPDSLHVVDRYMELLRPLGIEDADVDFQLPLYSPAQARINALLETLIGSDDPVVMHPGAGWNSKLWPHMRYAEVAVWLGRRLGIPTVIAWAGKRMHRWVKQIVRRSQGHAVAAPPLTLPELTALLNRAQLYLGSDSGPLHMAAALDVPTVSMFGPTTPDRNGPYRQGHSALQVSYQSGTTRQKKRARNDAMRQISTDMVIEACLQMLDTAAATRSAERRTSAAA